MYWRDHDYDPGRYSEDIPLVGGINDKKRSKSIS